jgi:hypothetical protein
MHAFYNWMMCVLFFFVFYVDCVNNAAKIHFFIFEILAFFCADRIAGYRDDVKLAGYRIRT